MNGKNAKSKNTRKQKGIWASKIVSILSIVFVIVCFTSSCNREFDTFATLYGIVSDSETNEPISGANVVLAPGSRNQITNTEGYFEFEELESMQYNIQVSKSGYATNYKSITPISGEKTAVYIQITKN